MSSTVQSFDNHSLITPALIRRHQAQAARQIDLPALEAARTELLLLFEVAQRWIGTGQALSPSLNQLSLELHKLRRSLPAGIWAQLVPVAQVHPLTDALRADPFTDWSFRKPRGYSGDAQLLDYIYGHPSARPAIESAGPVGTAIYGCTSASASSAAVRERRTLLASYVDAISAGRNGEAEILTIAAGHLREAELSDALRAGAIRRWVALDQDPDSVKQMASEHRETVVQPLEGSVAGLLRGEYGLGQFDFVYAAGLYDYLPRAVAIKLTRRCMAMLKPNGVFLFANFSDRTKDDGFMEIFMNWELLLRSDEEMWDIVNNSVDRNGVDASVLPGENGEIAYGLIRKLT